MDFKTVFNTIKETFKFVRKVDFEEYGLHFEMEPLTSNEEIKVMEVIKKLEGSEYIDGLKQYTLAYAIKKINDLNFRDPVVEYEDDNGQKKSESPYLFLLKQVEGWPAPLRDMLFDVFQDMVLELEDKIEKNAKFKRFQVQREEVKEKTPKFKQIEESVESLTETEKLNKQVEKEQEIVEKQIQQT
jgi:hypothetical protein